MQLIKCDEFDTLIRGIQFVDATNPTECYYWANATDETRCKKVQYDFSNPYPFLIVNIGSGVSVLAVYGPDNFRRISGTRLEPTVNVTISFFYLTFILQYRRWNVPGSLLLVDRMQYF